MKSILRHLQNGKYVSGNQSPQTVLMIIDLTKQAFGICSDIEYPSPSLKELSVKQLLILYDLIMFLAFAWFPVAVLMGVATDITKHRYATVLIEDGTVVRGSSPLKAGNDVSLRCRPNGAGPCASVCQSGLGSLIPYISSVRGSSLERSSASGAVACS